jgi:large subunit ribosomal protein L1
MPNPKTGTVTNDIAAAIAELKRGRTEFRADKGGVIHIAVGKASRDAAILAENVGVLLSEVMRKKASDVKGNFVRTVSLSSTMGPGVWVNYKEAE